MTDKCISDGYILLQKNRKEDEMFGVIDHATLMKEYEDRKVDAFSKGDLQVSTCAVTDSKQSYETSVRHPLYNERQWITVELYDTLEEAQKGHDKWVTLMTAKDLPKQLMEVSTASIAMVISSLDPDWRIKKKGK